MHGSDALQLLAITATLYYTTSPQAVGSKTATNTPARNPLAHLSKVQNVAPDNISPAQRVWQILNPQGDPLVHVRIESPTILVLGETDSKVLDSATADTGKPVRPRVSRFRARILRPLVWLLKTFVMPITGTTLLLYGILLYLLKDAELLEAQRHAAEPDSPPSDEAASVEGGISFTTLPRAFATDVDLIASSEDGKTVATVGLQNEFVIWRTETQSHVVVDTSNFVLGSASTPSAATTITAVAMNKLGNVCAVGTGSGIIAVFLIGKDQVKPLPHLQLDQFSSGVTCLHFTGSFKAPSGAAPSTRPTSPAADSSSQLSCHLYASYECDYVVEWDILSFTSPRYIRPSRAASVIKSMLLPIQADGRLLIGFSLDDGVFELCDVNGPNPVFKGECSIAAGNPSDPVAKAHVCSVELDGSKRILVAAATQAGVISLWDVSTRECLFILEEPFGDIGALKLSPVNTSVCTTCGELPIENFSMTFSVGHIVQFYRAYLTLPTRRCSCPRNLPQQAPRSSLLSHRSRSGSSTSVASTGTNTPVRPRSRMSSISESPPSAFPVSGHGVHSRRASDKDTLRRASETFFLNNPDYFEDDPPLGPQDVTPASSFLATPAQPSIWQSLVVVRVAEATIERGGWDVGRDKVVGIRRRARQPLPRRTSTDPKAHLLSEYSGGLTAAALDRWELWTFDPTEGRLQASPLLALSREPPRRRKYETNASTGSVRLTAPLPKRRGVVPRLHFTRVSPFVSTPNCCFAGFGNTVGLFRFDAARTSNSGSAGPSSGSLSKPPKEGRHGSVKAE